MRDAPIEQLAADLDAVDIEFNNAFAAGLNMADGLAEICHRHFIARQDYFSAIRGPVLAARRAPEADRNAPCDIDTVLRAEDAMKAGQEYLARIFEAGSDFSSARERLDAEAAEELAESNYELLSEKYFAKADAKRALREARRNGTVKRVKVRNGFVPTGGYVRVDGVRIQIVERVQ
jgi:hypothetical protein